MHFYLYQPLLIWLIITAIFEHFKPGSKANRVFFFVSMSVMALMQIFRYDQGMDYWGYKKLYVEAPLTLKYALQFMLNTRTHCEIGFKLFNYIFRLLGLSSFWFYAVMGTITIVLLSLSIIRYGKRINLAALIFYPTLFLTYVMSGVRQAFSTSLFLCFGLKYLREKKYFKYILIVLLCACFHRYTIILLVLVPINVIREKWLMISIPIVWILGIIYIVVSPLRTYLSQIISEQSQLYRFTQINVSWLGIAERTICFAIITFLFWTGTKSDLNRLLYKIYSAGYLINVLLMTTDYGSQRISMPLKMVEIILIPILVAECGKKIFALLAIGAVIAIEAAVGLKNLHFYNIEYTFINRPYISVFGIEGALKDDNVSEWEDMWNEWYKSYPTGTEYIKYYLNQRFGS